MTTYALPTTLAPARLEWGLRTNTWKFESPLTANVQTVELPGARWVATFAYQDMSNLVSPEYEAFIAKLRGMANRFTAYNFFRSVPLGTLRGTLTVNGAFARGVSTVSITGGAGQASKTLLPGDFISINGELKIVRDLMTTNGSGIGSVTFDPGMRNAVVGGESVVWDRPTATFMLTDNVTQWQYETTALRNLQFTAVEAW